MSIKKLLRKKKLCRSDGDWNPDVETEPERERSTCPHSNLDRLWLAFTTILGGGVFQM